MISITTTFAAVPVAGFGKALDFDGVNDYVVVTNDPIFELTDGTIEMWFKPNWIANSMGYMPALMANRDGQPSRYSFHIRDNLSQIGLFADGPALWRNYSFNQGQWYHVAFVENGSNTEIFINGISQGLTGNGFSTVTGLPLHIGSSNRDSEEYFKGQIDEVRIWNISRTQAQIQTGMNKTLQGNESGLVAYYDFEDGIGTTLTDKTANNNNGTLTNMDNSDWINGIIGNPTFTINSNTTLNDTLSAYDADGDTLTYSIVGNPSKGSVSITNANTGAFTYTPNANYNGSDSFTYKVNANSYKVMNLD
jgi:hypothetical protein